MGRKRDMRVREGYPSILDLALKAGKWSFVAGSSAAILGTTACGPIPTTGVLELDGQYWQDGAQDTGDAVESRDVAVFDSGAFADEWVDPDPGLMGDDTHVADIGADSANDIQVVDQGVDWGPTAGVPYVEDGWDGDTTVQSPDVADAAGDAAVDDDAGAPPDAVETDPGLPLPGEPIADIFGPSTDVQE